MDKRAMESKEALKQAFFQLLAEKEPEKITVRMLCERAHVNRSTFYAHFEYMGAFVQELLREEIRKISCAVAAKQEGTLEEALDLARKGEVSREEIRIFLDQFLEHPIFLTLLRSSKGEGYRQMIVGALVELTLSAEYRPARAGYYAYFQNSGVCSTIVKWIQDGMVVPKSQIIEMICRFSKTMYPEP